MLSYQTVEPHTLELLKALMAEPLFADMRLVGGTALALQYGHRQSVDLDMFGVMPEDSESCQEVSKPINLFGCQQRNGYSKKLPLWQALTENLSFFCRSC